MTYLHRLFGSRVTRQTRQLIHKFPIARRLTIEQLEARINPTDVVVSSLLFRGDLVADGALWKATGKPIEVGFNPTGTEAFKSLVTLAGDTVIDSAKTLLQFKGTGSFPSSSGLVDFWSSTSLSSFDIQKMVSGGEAIQPKAFTVAGLNFHPGKLLFENPNGGSTEDARLSTQGKLDFAALPGFTLAVDGSNQVQIDPAGVKLTGVSASLSGDFKAAGATFTGTKLVAAYSAASQTFSVHGGSSILFGTNSATVNLGETGKPGLVIQNGSLSSFNAGLTGNFQVAGTKVATNALNFLYDKPTDKISLTGTTSITFGDNSASLSLNNQGLVIRSGAIESLDATMDGEVNVDGTNLHLHQVEVAYSKAEKLLRVTGAAQISIGAGKASLDFADDGLVIQDGAVESCSATLDGLLSVAGASMAFTGISVYYSRQDGEFSLSDGTASLTLGANKASVALGERGLVIQSGEIESVDATFNGNIAVAGTSLTVNDLAVRYTRQSQEFRMGGAVHIKFDGFDLAAALAADNGLVIRSGAVESVNAKVNGSVAVAGAKISLTDTAVTYSRQADRLTASGKLAFAYESNSFSVALRNTGLVIEKGEIASVDGVAEGKIQVAGTAVTLDKLAVAYDKAGKRLQLTGGASVTVGDSSVAFNFLADKGGLLIQNGVLASVAASAEGLVVIDENKVEMGGLVNYDSAERFLQWNGDLKVNTASGQAFSGSGLLRVRGGVIEKVDARLGGEISLAGVKVRANDLAFTLETTGDVSGLRLSMPEGASGKPSLKIIIPAIKAGKADTEITVPRLEISGGLRMSQGRLQSFSLQVGGSFQLNGLAVQAERVFVSYSTADATVITVQGEARVGLDRSSFGVVLGKKDGKGSFTSPGFKLVNGVIDTVEAEVTGNLTFGNGFTMASAEAGLTYNPEGEFEDVEGNTQTGPVWGIYGNFSPFGWKFTPLLALGTKADPAILIHMGNLVDGGSITVDLNARFGPFIIEGVVSMRPVAADTYVESNGIDGWQPGETLLVDQNRNGAADPSHFVIAARARLAIPFWKEVLASIEFDTTGSLKGISLSIPTDMPVPGTPLVMTALGAKIENLDNPSSLIITGSVGLSMYSFGDLVSKLDDISDYYDKYLDAQMISPGTLPDIPDPELPTFTPAHFVGQISYSPGKLVLTVDAYLFAMGTGSEDPDTFKQVDGEWSGLVEAHGTIYLDWANKRYYAALEAEALGGIFKANALLGMDFAKDIYVVQAGATFDVHGTIMDFWPLNEITPIGANFIVLISPSKKMVGGWVDTWAGPYGVGYNFSTNEIEYIDKSVVKSLRQIASEFTGPPPAQSVPVDQRVFKTDFTFRYKVSQIEAASGLPLDQTNVITLSSSFLILDNLAYERTA